MQNVHKVRSLKVLNRLLKKMPLKYENVLESEETSFQTVIIF